MKAAQWIDRVKAENGWDSDYRAAKELHVSRNTISNYRSKPEATMDDDLAVRVAEALHVAPEFVLVDQVAERTKSEAARAAWSGLLKRMGGKVRAGGGSGAMARVDITSVSSSVADPEGAAGAHARARYALHLLQPCSSLRRTVADWFQELYTPPPGLAPA